MSNSEEFDRATTAYEAAIDLRKLGSDQVLSRLSAMLTANTIIIAVSGLAITNQAKIPPGLIPALISGGLLLCLVWGFLYFMDCKLRIITVSRRKNLSQWLSRMGNALPSGPQIGRPGDVA